MPQAIWAIPEHQEWASKQSVLQGVLLQHKTDAKAITARDFSKIPKSDQHA